MAYQGCLTRSIINNAVTKSITVVSSLRQGCPLSPLLFALYIEPLCLSVQMSKIIPGFALELMEIKLLAYFDDVAIFCTDKQSVNEAVAATNEFCDITGAVVNWGKRWEIRYGDWPPKPDRYQGMNWTSTPCNYLGVPLQHFKNSSQYWADKAVDLNRKAKKRANRDLSIFARATVCNIFLVARIRYVLQAMALSTH